MKYYLNNVAQAAEALKQLVEWTKEGKLVDMKTIKPRRTLPQNRYLHLLLGAFGHHFGYTKDEAKFIYKDLNADLYRYEKEVRGKRKTFYKSSKTLTKEEMAKSIDVLREWSEKAGFPLPEATDQQWLREIDNQIEREGIRYD